MLEIVSIGKTFNRQHSGLFFNRKSNDFDLQSATLKNVNLTIQEGEFFSLLGPSGCGKTTLLRIICGLETQSTGKILLEGREIQNLPPQKRPFNMVFQRYALFPHLTVEENLAFGLEINGVGIEERQKRIAQTLELVDLSDLKKRLPETLSGGQQQRVALARALVNRPKILLLDEPLSALDLKMREHMQRELRILQKKLGLTFIYVTHDQEEALTLSDRIGIMNQGKLEQVSSPRDLYEAPQTRFAAQFVGSMNELKLNVVFQDTTQRYIDIEIDPIWGTQRISFEKNLPYQSSKRIHAFIRPEKISISLENNQRQQIPGTIIQSIFRGNQLETHVDTNSQGIIRVIGPVLQSNEHQVGQSVFLNIAAEHLHLFGD